MAVLTAWQTLNKATMAVLSINCRRSLDALGTLAKRAKARDEEARPFPKPDTGRIAIKVINHYGD